MNISPLRGFHGSLVRWPYSLRHKQLDIVQPRHPSSMIGDRDHTQLAVPVEDKLFGLNWTQRVRHQLCHAANAELLTHLLPRVVLTKRITGYAQY